MSKIRILPEQLANQIAAGEVVERPASVVKELLENSLDAGSTNIEIEIEGGGTRLIRIIDNGEGMDEDDLLLCLERHGTSKIRNPEDLEAIDTLGFRGEAIPSIGSVSNMTITSRTAESPLGTQAVLKYGKLQQVHETGSAKGTVFEIKNLFGNTPARRKFLRTARTELGHIEEAVKNYALASPEITFILRVDGREIIHLDRSMSLEARVKTIMHYKDDMIAIDKTNSHSKHSIHGFLIPPDKPVTGAAKLRLFVNNRAIKDRMLTHAVNEGLRGFLMKGRYPAGLLHVTLPPEQIDVNVHPAKHEIRFRNSRDVHLLVSSATRESMLNYQSTIRSDIFGATERATTPVPQQSELTSVTPEAPLPQELPDTFVETNVAEPLTENKDTSNYDRESSNDFTQALPTAVSEPEPTSEYRDATITKAPPSEQTSITNKQSSDTYIPNDYQEPVHSNTTQIQNEHTGTHGLKIIGQLQNLYILCQNEHGLFVIDQHAAHERLLFEELRAQYLSNNLASQNLLFPETVELSIFQTQLVEKNLEQLERMGFSLRDFGGNTFIISAVPALAGNSSASTLFFDILDQFGSEHGSSSGANRLDDILASIACKAAIKAGNELDIREIDALLKRMAKANLFSHCPHGRPVFKQFTQNDIKKWFHRT